MSSPKFAPLEELAGAALDYKHVHVDLLGEDGNIFSIMGRATKALRRKGKAPSKHIELFLHQVRSSESYDEALGVVMGWVCTGTTCDKCLEDL